MKNKINWKKHKNDCLNTFNKKEKVFLKNKKGKLYWNFKKINKKRINKKRIKNLRLLKIYNNSIQKWINCYELSKTRNNKKELFLKIFDKCSFCNDKFERLFNTTIEFKKCYCPSYICSWCYNELKDMCCLFSKIEKWNLISEIKYSCKQIINELNFCKIINCFKNAESINFYLDKNKIIQNVLK